jgi:hypothetical protein
MRYEISHDRHEMGASYGFNVFSLAQLALCIQVNLGAESHSMNLLSALEN